VNLSDVFRIQDLLTQEDSLSISLFNLAWIRHYQVERSKEGMRWNTEPYGLCRLC